MTGKTTFSARVLRKADDLPRYIDVSAEHVAGRTATFEAEVTLNGGDAFVQNIRP